MFKMIIIGLSLISFFNSQSSDSNATQVDRNEKNSKEQNDNTSLILPDIEFKDFDKKRDEAFIKYAFKHDHAWLAEDPAFDIDFMMDNKAPNRDHPEYIGKLNIKILFVKGKPAGFTTYYMLNFFEGRIDFIYIHPDFRNKGFGEKLTSYDIDQLFKMDAYIIRMSTRVDNAPAIKIYRRIGFIESSRNDKFIDYTIKNNNPDFFSNWGQNKAT